MEEANQLICSFNRYIFWGGFLKGIAFTCAILAGIQIYKYLKNKSIKIEIKERKEPKL